MAKIKYRVKDKGFKLESREQLFSAMKAVFKHIYAISPPYIGGKYVTSHTPLEGLQYLYLKKKPTKKISDNRITISIESVLNVRRHILEVLETERGELSEEKVKTIFDIVTPMIMSPVAMHKGKEIQLSPGPYPDIITGLIIFGRDLKIGEIEDIVVSGLVRIAGFRRLSAIKVDEELYGVKGEIIVEFLEKAVSLKDALQILPFLPLGRFIDKGYGVTILRNFQ